TFTYTPAAGTVLSAGANQTLSATFQPADPSQNASASASVKVNVVKASPVVTWATPADIVAGTALSATQLNATAAMVGTFTYTPRAGTVLKAGANQVLSATFTPADAVNYTTASVSVLLNVKAQALGLTVISPNTNLTLTAGTSWTISWTHNLPAG